MFLEKELMFSTSKDDYEKRSDFLARFHYYEQYYGSLVLMVIVIILAIYLIKIKRYKRFEWIIVIVMFINHSLRALITTDSFKIWIYADYTRTVIFWSIFYALMPTLH